MPTCYTISNDICKYEPNLFTYIGYTLLGNLNIENSNLSNWSRYYYYDINGKEYSDNKFYYYPNFTKHGANNSYGIKSDYNDSLSPYAHSYIVTKYGDKSLYCNFLWNTVQIVPDYDKLSYHGEIKESSGFYFTCPKNNVILYRWHGGSENGTTMYAYAPLKLNIIYKNGATYTNEVVPKNYKVEIDYTYWTPKMKESDTYGNNKGLHVPSGYAWTGRMHTGDENGQTQYQVGRIKVTINDEIITCPYNIHSTKYYDDRKESKGNWDKWFHPRNTFIISRQHSGDENKTTWYTYSYYRINL